MKKRLLYAMGLVLMASAVCAHAEDVEVAARVLKEKKEKKGKKGKKKSKGGGDWCESLQDIGTLYKSKKNPWIQRVEIFGRADYQVTYVDGTTAGNDYYGYGEDLQRLRVGASVEFLDRFRVLGRVNLTHGEFRDPSIRYDGFDKIYIECDFDDVGIFENLTLGYGRYKIGFGGEEWTSSKKIKTIERSNLNSYYGASRSTGVRAEFEVGDVDFILGVYSTTDDDDWSRWDTGEAYHIAAEFEALGGDVVLQGLYNDATEEEDETVGYEWGLSASYEIDFGRFEVFTNTTYGQNHDGDALYGVVVMPSYEIIDDKLEAVFRYQWFQADGDATLKGTKNFLRRVSDFKGVIDPRGHENHTFYAGLNYLICDHNLKLMMGVEYETVDGGRADAHATTAWSALRFYF